MRLAQIIASVYLAFALVLTGVTVLIGPIGNASFPLPRLGPAGEPVIVSIAYGTEKREWFEEAKRRFEATSPRVGGRPIEVQLQGVGSREIVFEIVQEQRQPTVVSPASSIQIELLHHEWQKRKGTSILLSGDDAPRPLVLTPLVMVVWEERANILWPNGPRNFWDDLHSALRNARGWEGLGGDVRWGPVKFGHTSPETSNSGMQTLVLMAYGYYDKSRDLTIQEVNDARFLEWLQQIEQAVAAPAPSTGVFMENFVRQGPGGYDFVMIYENLAIQNADAASRLWGPIRVYYPPATIISDHPYAILNAPWVSSEQRAAAARFRDFLLSREIQELALQSGFRPVDPEVSIQTNDPNNPFNRYAASGITPDITQQVVVPPAEVLNELIDVWTAEIQR
ncbi:MAG: substrate-binding domain-containing protein [Chloroflexales bacterium]|nr:substrate-binding domain-containing protein [Chloroflexales bacterium]